MKMDNKERDDAFNEIYKFTHNTFETNVAVTNAIKEVFDKAWELSEKHTLYGIQSMILNILQTYSHDEEVKNSELGKDIIGLFNKLEEMK